MTEVEIILKMIETVSPDDTAKLDKIDKVVWNYLHPNVKIDEDASIITCAFFGEYTRSRDALKAIRPEGWYFETKYHGFTEPKISSCLCYSEKSSILSTSYVATEELAELHAIIQAIEYNRNKSTS